MRAWTVGPGGKNNHWLVCRTCFSAWPPSDIRPGHTHFEGDAEDEPWIRCDGPYVELREVSSSVVTESVAPTRLAELHHAIEVYVVERGDGERHIRRIEWTPEPDGSFAIRVELI